MRFWRKPLDFDQIVIPHGEVIIINDRCKGCGFCAEYCPKGVLVMSDQFNVKGYHPPKVIKSGECVNCNLCEMICPEFAIYSVEVPGGTTAGKAAETLSTVESAKEEKAWKQTLRAS